MSLFLQIQNIRFPPGKSKGFGYCDFEDRQSLIEALNLNDEQIRNRKVRIDLADQHQSKKSQCHYEISLAIFAVMDNRFYSGVCQNP